MNKYYIVTFILTCFAFCEDLVYEYNLTQGANLVSFPVISENYAIDYFFSSSNNNLYSTSAVEDHINSIITEGELTFIQDGDWIGSLSEINTKKGYWLIAEENFSFVIITEDQSENLYYLHPGGNLISYPFNQDQPYYEAIPFLSENLLAVLGENEALYNNNGMLMGSLQTFKPGKGYWFILNEYSPFQFNQPGLNTNLNHNIENIVRDDEELPFNQSTLQSAFFIESIFLSGEQNFETINLEAICNNITVGKSDWQGEFSDLIVMGDDGFDLTQNYCTNDQNIIIQNNNSNQVLYNISGETNWQANNFELLILSDSDFGDLNFNQIINISDIIIMIEHIIGANSFNNNHQELLADINQDNAVNITDVISIISQILNF